MRFIILSVAILLASCASSPNSRALEDRLASWNGAPVQSLSNELGDPSVTTSDMWEWRFVQRRSHSSSASSSLSRSTGVRCSNCDTNSQPSSYSVASMSSSTRSTGSAGGHDYSCGYRATIEDEVIVAVEAFRISGRCRFKEIGMRLQD